MSAHCEKFEAARAWLCEHNPPEGLQVGIDEVQFNIYAGGNLIADHLLWSINTYPEDEEGAEDALFAFYQLSRAEPVARYVLGTIMKTCLLLEQEIPPMVSIWSQESLLAEFGLTNEAILRDIYTAPPKTKTKLPGVISDAAVFVLVEAARERFDLSITRNEASEPISACDAVGAMWRHYGGDHIQTQDAIRKRYYRAKQRLESQPKNAATIAEHYITYVFRQVHNQGSLPI